jgi:ribosomal protein S18 acetylase RimI-like enzyme
VTEEPRVRSVSGGAARRAYLSLIRAPYEQSPQWAHPDTRILERLLRGRSLLAARSDHRSLLAEEDGRPVACMTVFLHRSFEEKLRQKIATIGFFEALRGHERAVARLFAEAESWARERGAGRIWGPINGHVMYGFGCLENRYGETPVVGTAYNLPDYPVHWWGAGFRKAPSFYSYRIDLASRAAREAIDRAATSNATPADESRPAIHVRPASPASWQREVGIFIDVHNAAFERNWGDTPLSHDEMWELMGLARHTIDPEMFSIAEIDGRPVGLVLAMPDLNQAFRRVRSKPASVRGALALLLFRRSVRRGALMTIAVLPEARRRGLGEYLAARAMRRMIERGLTEMEYCLVLEDNVPSQRIAQRFGGEHTKTYLMFEKVLA